MGDLPEYEWAGDARVRDDHRWACRATFPGTPRWARFRAASGVASTWRGCSSATGTCSMLDEPTNHLDMRAITWLARPPEDAAGARAQGALLVVTHDRWFLDEVCHEHVGGARRGRSSRSRAAIPAYILQRVERDRLAALAEQKRQQRACAARSWHGSRAGRGRVRRSRSSTWQRLRRSSPTCPLCATTLELQAHGHGAPGQAGGRPRARDGALRASRRAHGARTTSTGSSARATATASWARTARARRRCCSVIQGAMQPTPGVVKIGKTVRFAVLSQHLGRAGGAGRRPGAPRCCRATSRRIMLDGKEMHARPSCSRRLGFSMRRI